MKLSSDILVLSSLGLALAHPPSTSAAAGDHTIINVLSGVSASSVGGLNCSNIITNGLHWDISPLFTKNLNLTVITSQHEDISLDVWGLFINLCRPLDTLQDIVPADQCLPGAYSCRLVTNWKQGAARITSVKLYSSTPPIIVSGDQESLQIELGVNNTVNFDLSCAQTDSMPQVKRFRSTATSYGGELMVTWSHRLFCPTGKATGNPSGANGGDGEGWTFFDFIWNVLVLFIAYLVIGTGYNYFMTKTWRIPHQEFWTDVSSRASAIGSKIYEKATGRQSQYVAI